MRAHPFREKTASQVGRWNLNDVCTTLEKLHLTWWIEAGTFLGCIRGPGRFIGHDTDIDVGVLGVEAAEEIKDNLYALGFELAHVFGQPERGLEYAFTRNGVKVDVFFFYAEGDTLYHAAWWHDKMIRLEFPRAMILPTISDTMEGVDVRTPADHEGYLTRRYGPDWRTPKKEWNWAKDPKCINWEKSDVKADEITSV